MESVVWRYVLAGLVTTVVVPIACRGANLIPNSSFETGPRRWLTFIEHDDSGNTNQLRDLIVSGGSHGSRCLKLPERAYVRSSPVWLSAGSYTVSFDGRYTGSPTSLRVSVEPLDGSSTFTAFSLTSSWVRRSTSIAIGKSSWYYVQLVHFSPSTLIFVDAVQLQPGGATAYAPSQTVEAGLSTSRPFNTFFSTDAKSVQVNWWNNGEAVTKKLICQVFDVWNREVDSRTLEKALAARSSATSTLTLPLNGWQRVVTRIADMADSRDELTATVLPVAPAAVVKADGRIGGHFNWSGLMLTNARAAGYTWTRALSAAGGIDQWNLIEPSWNVFVWPDAAIANLTSKGLKLMVTLGTKQSSINTGPLVASSWMTNADGGVNLSAYSNFVWRYADRYKGKVAAYEIWNEPARSQGEWISRPTNYASVLSVGAAAVKRADPLALVVAMGGPAEVTWASDVWNQLSPSDKANIDAVSCHLYPIDNGTADDMNNSASYQRFDYRPAQWRQRFGSVRPIWNTESGTWMRGDYRTEANLWGFRTEDASPLGEYQRAEACIRTPIATERILKSALRCLGNQFDKYFYYGNWSWSTEMIPATHPTVWDLGNSAPRAVGAALSILSAFVDRASAASPATNASLPVLEMYQFKTAGASNVVALFNMDRVYRRLTVTNTGFRVYDCMGNQQALQDNSFLVSRMPQYVVSETLSAAQLSNTLCYASAALVNDSFPPNVSVDIAPSGVWGGGRALLKWSANDGRWWNDSSNPNSVEFAWKLDSGGYTAYSQTNFVWANIPAGNHVLWVRARDRDGNVAEVSYEFAPGDAAAEAPQPPTITSVAP